MSGALGKGMRASVSKDSVATTANAGVCVLVGTLLKYESCCASLAVESSGSAPVWFIYKSAATDSRKTRNLPSGVRDKYLMVSRDRHRQNTAVSTSTAAQAPRNPTAWPRLRNSSSSVSTSPSPLPSAAFAAAEVGSWSASLCSGTSGPTESAIGPSLLASLSPDDSASSALIGCICSDAFASTSPASVAEIGR